MTSDLFIDEWSQAARELGLEFDAPFVLPLPSGSTARARLRLRHFGGEYGMFVVTDWPGFELANEVVAAGFGFSTLSEPSSLDGYNRDGFVRMLRDWTWTGPQNRRPAWCSPLEEEHAEESGP